MAHATSIRTQLGSPFLSLPAEVRNQIYECVGKDIKFGIIGSYGHGVPGISSVQHPLARVCRQLRCEFSPIAVEAARSCRVIKIHCKNFNMPPADLVLDILASLPPHPARRYSQTVSIDKHFGHKFRLKVLDVLGGLHGLNNDGDLIKLEPVACEVKVTAEDFDVLKRAHDALHRARGNDDGEIAVEIALHAAMSKALEK